MQSFAEKFIPLLPEDPMRQFGMIMETMLRLINENLAATHNQSLSLENMFEKVPVLKDIFNALGIQGHTLEILLTAPVNNGRLLLEVLLGGDKIQEAICKDHQLEQLLRLPQSFNTTVLYEAICVQNTSLAITKLTENLDIQNLTRDFISSSATVNWSEIFRESKELQQNIMNLIKSPPVFNVTSFVRMLESNYSTSNLWNMASAYSSLAKALEGFPEFKILESIVKTAGVVVEFLNALSQKLLANGMTIDLASLFSGSPSFIKLVNSVLHLQPNPLVALYSIQLKTSKVQQCAVLENIF